MLRFKKVVIGVSILLLLLVVVSLVNSQWFSFIEFAPVAPQDSLPQYITVYAYGSSGLLSKQTGGEVSYYHSDSLGSSSLVTDFDGKRIYSSDYTPFGSSLHEQGEERYTYTGKELDDSTGLYYYGARYYDSSLGRFISSDPVQGSVYSGQRLNRYTYVMNNPMVYTDPSGAAPTSAQILTRLETNYGTISSTMREGPTYAQYIPSYLKGNAGGIIDSLLLAYQRYEGRNLDLDFFVARVYKEGLGYYTHAPSGPIPEEDMTKVVFTGMLGLNSFGDLQKELKQNDYLREDYTSFNGYSFANLESALEGEIAVFLYYQDMFLNDAKAKGIDTSTLTQDDIGGWSYVYFNIGPNRGDTLLERYGVRGLYDIGRGKSGYEAFRNARTILDAENVLEQTELFKE